MTHFDRGGKPYAIAPPSTNNHTLLTIHWVYTTLCGVLPKEKPANPIFNRVRLLRTERNLSRAQLAEQVKVNPQTIGALERGDHSPSLDLAFRICEAFDLPVEAVFSRTEFTPMSTTLYGKAR